MFFAACLHRARMPEVDPSASSLLVPDFFLAIVSQLHHLDKRAIHLRGYCQGVLASMCNWLDLIVEASKSDPMWTEEGHMALLQQPNQAKQRSRRVEAGLKRALSIELYNRKGHGLRTMSQLIQGVDIGRKTAPSLRQRRARRLSASSQPGCLANAAMDVPAFQMYNLYRAIQSLH